MARYSDGKDKIRDKDLAGLERELDIADRLEIGIAQSKLLEILFLTYDTRLKRRFDAVTEYNEIVKGNRGRLTRSLANRLNKKLKTLERKIKRDEEEMDRIRERLTTDAVGFVVVPPKFKAGRP